MKKILFQALTVMILVIGLIISIITPVFAEDTASKIVFSNNPLSTFTAGQVSGIMTVQIQTASGTPFNVTADTTVNLSSTSATGLFDRTVSGTFSGSVTSVVIPKGYSSIDIYYKDTIAGTKTITASSTGLTSATLDIVILQASLSKLGFTTPVRNFNAGKISKVITVQTQDTYGNAVAVASDTIVNLSSASAAGKFDTSVSGLFDGSITSVTILNGSNSADFYYKDTTIGFATITAASTGLTATTQSQGVAGTASRLSFTSDSQTYIEAGKTSEKITIETKDGSGVTSEVSSNTVIYIISTSDKGRFDTITTGAFNGSINSVIIVAGTSSVDFYYRDTIAGTATILASSTGLGSTYQNVTINAAPGRQIVFTSLPQLNIIKDKVSNVITIRVKDEYGNDSSLIADTTFKLESTSTTGKFDIQASGSFDGSITSVTIAAGGTATSFYYRDSNKGDITITLSATDFSVISQAAKIITVTNLWVILGPILFVIVCLVAYLLIFRPVMHKRKMKKIKVIKTKRHTHSH